MEDIIYKSEAYVFVGLCMEIHSLLGPGFLEVVYKDAIEYELKKENILYEREKKYPIQYKDVILKHNFFADFVIWDKIIVEIKAIDSDITEIFTAKTINYLKASGCKLGLIINFGQLKLHSKRIVF